MMFVNDVYGLHLTPNTVFETCFVKLVFANNGKGYNHVIFVLIDGKALNTLPGTNFLRYFNLCKKMD